MRASPFAALSLLISLTCTPALATRPYRGGAVATAHPAASEAALKMLNLGGNATDAAVAAAFTLAVVGPYHSGIGGGGFALVHDAKTPRTRVLDFRETAPAKASKEMFLREGKPVPELSRDGGLSVAVPGAVAGYLELLKTEGTLPVKTVLQPAIAAARNGFWVTPKYQALARMRLDCLARNGDAARLFLRPSPDGTPAVPEIGTVLKQPELASTLSAISQGGADRFYRGSVAQAMVKAVASAGGVLSLDDLQKFKVRWRDPLEGQFRGHRVLTMPPPSAGGVALLQVLGVTELAGPAAPFHSPDALHRFAETLRRAYIDRAKYLQDPAFMPGAHDPGALPALPGLVAKLVSKEHIQALAKSIDPSHATRSDALLPSAPSQTPNPPAASGPTEGKNTTHVSIIDAKGNAVSLTTTVNYAFGSCVVAPGTGILLNDEMDDFAAQALAPNAYGLVTGEANTVAPGKIPLSSMTPTLVFQKERPTKVMIAVGSPGGPTIPTTVMQVLLNVIDYGMDLGRAVAWGRVHHQHRPDALWVDPYGAEAATLEALKAKGHALQRQEGWGDAEAVMVDPTTGLRTAASDPRNEGVALGQD